MKNNVIKLISLVVLVPMMTACPKPKKNSNVVWSEEIDEAMILYCGEVLPFAELNKETLTYGYKDSSAVFFVYDDNEVNLLENYAELLVAAGFEETENEDYFGDTYISYDKTNEVGDISVMFGFDEGDDENLPGNYINVAVPEYINEDLLAEWGYEKQQGWPAQLVADTLEGSDITVPAVNENGEWWTASELSHDDEYGDWYCAYLATKGDFVEEMDAALLSAGCAFDDYWGGYCDPTEASDYFISVAKVRDFTIVNIEGPTLGSVPADYTIQGDGLTQESFGLTDGGTSYAEHTATGASGASYTEQCASAHGIQIRSKNNNSGIIGNSSSKTAKSITIVFDAETGSSGNERKVDIYASNTAFTIADMYSGSMTSIGSITYSSSNLVQSYTFTSDYHYIGLRSNNGAIYMTVVDVVWSD